MDSRPPGNAEVEGGNPLPPRREGILSEQQT